MLDQLRDTSTLPPRDLTIKSATRVSYAFKVIALAAVLVAFLSFFYISAAQPTVTKVSATVLAAPFSCQMLSKVATTFDISTANVSLPLISGADPPATLFAYPTAFDMAPSLNADTAVGCLNGGHITSGNQPVLSITYNSLYATFADCTADAMAASCSVSPDNFNALIYYYYYQKVKCTFGSTTPAPIQFTTEWQIYDPSGGFGMYDNMTPFPACAHTGTASSSASIAAAVLKVFPPSYLCAPFADGVNPPYSCTGTERAPIISIILQSLSLYTTTIALLAFTITTCLPLLKSQKNKLVTPPHDRDTKPVEVCV